MRDSGEQGGKSRRRTKSRDIHQGENGKPDHDLRGIQRMSHLIRLALPLSVMVESPSGRFLVVCIVTSFSPPGKVTLR